jgi:hypothetical protein
MSPYPKNRRGYDDEPWYLLVLCTASGVWHQADQCEAATWDNAVRELSARHPHIFHPEDPEDQYMVIPHHRLNTALAMEESCCG